MKTQTYFLTALILSAASVCAQETEPAPASRFKAGLTASADYCNQFIYYDGVLQQSSIFYNFELPAIGWSAGAQASYVLNPHFEITGGLRYREHRITSGPLILTDGSANEIGEIQTWYVNRYLDAPLGFQYSSHPGKKITFLANGTLAPGFAMGSWFKLKAESPDSLGIANSNRKQEIRNYNHFSLTAELYAGIGINFGDCQLQILPQARYHMLMVTTENPVNRRNWSTGLEVRFVIPI